MDINEQIVRAWLEIQGFLVKSRLKYKVKRVVHRRGGKRRLSKWRTDTYTGWSDIDLIAHRPYDGKRVAVDITAWMTEYISLSYVNDSRSNSYYRLFKSSFPEARVAIRQEFGVHNDKQYEIWLVVSYLAPTQKEQVEAECLKHVDRVVEFPTIMKELVDYIRQNPGPSQENEALQTIRALVLSEIL